MIKQLHKAVCDKEGYRNQFTVVVEELSELTKEICKYQRGIGDLCNIAEEIADVEIMCERLRFIFKFDDEVNHWKRYKAKRLQKRLKD